MIVAGFPLGGLSICTGDSGGALLLYDDKLDKWVQAGIFSWPGSDRDRCGNAYSPSISTRISDFFPFINDVTKINTNDSNFQRQIFSGNPPQSDRKKYDNYRDRLVEFSQDDVFIPRSSPDYYTSKGPDDELWKACSQLKPDISKAFYGCYLPAKTYNKCVISIRCQICIPNIKDIDPDDCYNIRKKINLVNFPTPINYPVYLPIKLKE